MKHSPVCIWNGQYWAEVGKPAEVAMPLTPNFVDGEWTLLKEGKYWGGLFKETRRGMPPRWTIKRGVDANELPQTYARSRREWSSPEAERPSGTYSHGEINSVLLRHNLVTEWSEPRPRRATREEIKRARWALRQLAA